MPPLDCTSRSAGWLLGPRRWTDSMSLVLLYLIHEHFPSMSYVVRDKLSVTDSMLTTEELTVSICVTSVVAQSEPRIWALVVLPGKSC